MNRNIPTLRPQQQQDSNTVYVATPSRQDVRVAATPSRQDVRGITPNSAPDGRVRIQRTVRGQDMNATQFH